LLAAGTDGTDGPGEDAGALVDGNTIARGQQHGMDAESALAQADAGSFLEASGDLLRTGPTGTNVMDLMLGLRY
jgi:glycerate 2-kinase